MKAQLGDRIKVHSSLITTVTRIEGNKLYFNDDDGKEYYVDTDEEYEIISTDRQSLRDDLEKITNGSMYCLILDDKVIAIGSEWEIKNIADKHTLSYKEVPLIISE